MIASATCAFETIEGAVDSVIETVQLGIPVARIELLDEVQVRACNSYSQTSLPEVPTLFIELHGSEAATRSRRSRSRRSRPRTAGPGSPGPRHRGAQRTLARAPRRVLRGAAPRSGRQGFLTDVCVPISRLAECLVETKRDLEGSFLQAPIVGHVGDGNFHVTLLVDPDDVGQIAEARRLNERMIERALALGGTTTGEHGVGFGKIAYVEQELGPAVDVMRVVKAALDPSSILNPGKIFRELS